MKNIKMLIIFLFTTIVLLSCKNKTFENKQNRERNPIPSQDSILKNIEALDNLKLRNWLSAASGNSIAYEWISKQDNVLYFIKYRNQSLPLLREHFISKDTITDVDRLKYFTIFGLSKDTLMLDTLYDYANRVKTESKSELDYTQHPYYFAMHGMELITGISMDPYPAYLIEPDVFLNKVKEWKEKYGKK